MFGGAVYVGYIIKTVGHVALDIEDSFFQRCRNNGSLRWLDIVFQGQYLPSLSVNCVAINKYLEKLTPQLY